MAKALVATKKESLKIHTVVAFINTQVRAINEDDRKMLLLMMRYLCGTNKLVLTLSADITNIFKWRVDEYYGVSSNCKGHRVAT